MNLLPEFGVSVDLRRHGRRLSRGFKGGEFHVVPPLRTVSACHSQERLLQNVTRSCSRCARRWAISIALRRWCCSNMASNPLWVRVDSFSLSVTNFISGLSLLRFDCSKSARNEEPSSRDALNRGLASGDSGLRVNLKIALGGVSAKVKPPQPAFENRSKMR